jgi:TonB family protein
MSGAPPAETSFAPSPPGQAHSVLTRAALAAFLIEAIILTAVGWHSHWLAHPQKTSGIDPSHFVEAQIFEMPEQTHLVTKEKQVEVAKPEHAISQVVDQGRKAKPNESIIPEKNEAQSDSGAPVAPTHGPVPVFTPAPVIPSYLQNQDLHASIVIEFLVTAQGVVTPRLLSSSGNEELDSIGLATAKRWQFRPGEDNHKAVDSKVRLRIVFEVH